MSPPPKQPDGPDPRSRPGTEAPEGPQPDPEATTPVPTQRDATQPLPPTDQAREDELASLRRQVETLNTQLARRTSLGDVAHGLRGVLAAVLAFLAAFGLAASLVGVWAERTALDTGRWVSTVGPLPQNTQVNAAVAQYLTAETFAVLHVEQRVAEALPPKASFLAGPLTGQVRDYLRKSVNKVLGTPQFQAIWERVNRTAHAQTVAVLENRSDVVRVQGNRVVLNLLPVVNEVLRALERRIPTIFGRDISLPALKSGQIPEGLKSRVESALGVSLPANFARITFYEGQQLGAVQDTLRLFKRVVVALVVGSLILLALALLVSTGRRRTVLQLGVWVALAVVVMGVLIRMAVDQVLQDVPSGTYRNGVESGLDVVVASLRDRGNLLLLLGIVVAVAAYLAGPGRGAQVVRRWTVRGGRALAHQTARGVAATRAHGPGFAARNLDALRVAGVVIAAVLAFLVVSSWTAFLVLVALLAAYEGIVTLAARSASAPVELDEPAGGPATATRAPVPPTNRTGDHDEAAAARPEAHKGAS